jgi:hypothetical protein
LIGWVWKRGNAWSLPVLIVRSASSLSLVNAHFRSELTKGNPDHSELQPGGFGSAAAIRNILRLPGDYSGTPPLDPIPNSTVKRSSADGTTLWESRSLPGIPRMLQNPLAKISLVCEAQKWIKPRNLRGFFACAVQAGERPAIRPSRATTMTSASIPALSRVVFACRRANSAT